MKFYYPFMIGLAVVSTAVLSAQVDSGSSTNTARSGNIEMIVVAEQSAQGTSVPRPTPEHPVYYITYDVGYIESGTPLGGLKPPSAGVVGQNLRAALESQGYQLATSQTPPSLVLVYSWGCVYADTQIGQTVINTGGITGAKPFSRFPNRALGWSFVLPSRIASQLVRSKSSRYSSSPLYRDSGLPMYPESVELNRNFLVVTAYDYAALQRHEKTLLWRVKLSASESSATMASALPALARAGAPYFGRDFNRSQINTAALLNGNEQAQSFTIPAEPAPQPDENLLCDLANRERNEFTDGPLLPIDDKLWKTETEKHAPAAPPASAATKDFEMIIIAERTEQGMKLETRSAEQPVYYLACDAGYSEAGRAMAGLTPPSPREVGHALRSSLDGAGFQLAGAGHVPTQVLVYHYGSLQSDGRGDFSADVDLNKKARFALVAPEKLARATEDYLIHQSHSNLSSRPARVRDVMDYAGSPRYFLIVSAYDYVSLTRQIPVLLWRVKLSTEETAGKLSVVIPALAGASGPYLGANSEDRQYGLAPAVPSPGLGTSLPTYAFVNSRKAVENLDRHFMEGLLVQERINNTGSPAPKGYTGLSVPTGGNRPALPPALAKRIASYLQEKIALQEILAAKIKASASSPDSRQQAIDGFNAEYASRILQLGRDHNAIRDELGQFAGSYQQATGKSLDALLKEFADVAGQSDETR